MGNAPGGQRLQRARVSFPARVDANGNNPHEPLLQHDDEDSKDVDVYYSPDDQDEKDQPTVAVPSLSRPTQPQHSHAISIRRPPHSRALSLQGLNASLSSAAYPTPSSPYQSCEPLDIFLSVFTYLSQRDLAAASNVSKRWSAVCYDASLWSTIHLCHMYHRVDDALLVTLLSSGRFPYLQYLCLDRCSAITDTALAAIHHYCPRLEWLSVVHCHRLTVPALIAFATASPHLRRLELIGVTTDVDDVVRGMDEAGRGDVELGFVMLDWCAKHGVKLKQKRRWSGLGTRRHSYNMDELDDRRTERATLPPLLPPPAPPAGSASASASASSSAAAQNVPPSRTVRAVCRHSRSVADNPGASACWGRVTGRLVLSSLIYHTAGNFPITVLYSCEQHSEADWSDPRYHRCAQCEQLIHPASMWDDMVCRTCFDHENITRRHNWIQLRGGGGKRGVREFGLSEIIGRTIRVAERKNLPVSLTSYKATECKLDYTLPSERDEEKEGERKEDGEAGGLGGGGVGEEDEKKAIVEDEAAIIPPSPARRRPPRSDEPVTAATPLLDRSQVPLTTFLSYNATRLDRTIDSLQSKLKQARDEGANRALLVLDDQERIEVLADSRVIADGIEGESHLRLVNSVWSKALHLVYPLILLFALSSLFAPLFHRLLKPPGGADPEGWIPRLQFTLDDAPSFGEQLDLILLFGILGVFIFLLVIGVVLWCRYRRHFELVFRKFLAVDIFAIFWLGTMALLVVSCLVLHVPGDWLTLLLVSINVACVSVYALYYEVNAQLHAYIIVYLNAIMAILLAGAIGWWVTIPFTLLFSLLDVLSHALPHRRILPPLLVPDGWIIPTKPSILLSVANVYVRPGELMWYGLLVTFVGVGLDVLVVLGCTGIWVGLVLVLPYVSGARRYRRPLPLMFVWCALLWWKYNEVIWPARLLWNGVQP